MSQRATSIRLCVMMFLQFFIWGSWYVTVGNYINAAGWDEGVTNNIIGMAYSVGPIAALISPLFLGLIADRYFATQKVLGVMHLLGGLLMFLVPVLSTTEGRDYLTFQVLLQTYMLFYMPTLGLTNTLAFHHITDQARQFPLIRVFGTLGWIAANIVVSKWLGADKDAVQFQLAGGASILLALYSFTLPHTPPPSAGKKASLVEALGLKSLGLLKDPSFAIFIFSSFLICIPLAAYYAYAPVFVDSLGVKDVAYHMSYGQWAEVVFMLVMPWFFARLGVKWMLAVGMLAWVVRYGLFSQGADDAIMWMVMGGILLHGICYDFFFVTGQIYVDQKAPVEIRGQAQGFLVLMTLGLGLFIGARVTAATVDAHKAEGAGAKVDWSSVWGLAALAAGAVLLLFLFLFRERKKT